MLVTGDVASEGVNLHAQCHELVHFDIPWSLIRIEQRNGRIDRYGQKHPPRITALLLDPSSERFAGDVRILATLIEKEDEAHTAPRRRGLADGRVRRQGRGGRRSGRSWPGRRDLDDVVRTRDEVAAGDDLAGLFAELDDIAADRRAGARRRHATPRTGLYPDDIAYLDEALHAAFIDPAAPPSNAGVSLAARRDRSASPSWYRRRTWCSAWRCCRRATWPTAGSPRSSCWPPPRRAARTGSTRRCATTATPPGRTRTTSARCTRCWTGRPTGRWPTLGRNEVFAVRGDVDCPTVLLLGTLTNRRGQVVAAAWLTVEFPDPDDPAFGLVTPHGSAAEALAALGWDQARSNPGAVRRRRRR